MSEVETNIGFQFSGSIFINLTSNPVLVPEIDVIKGLSLKF